ncbi:hypothetical protein FYR76_19210 [Salmonella enterica]|uniref:Glycosaminoglycan attachment site n=1 Tax=Salmonella enterica subsp. enterica serovar Typhi str. CT18 TaxID=220341 RepID=A0A716E0K9_SALTI|nr:hypothetical protein [Salmonella enterica]EHK1991644.1 hypothetical protein [Salmonella enterica subsp. enterica serovar Typhimurium]CRJ41908.1 Uncharacterised protein [Salmonella enterica subsp. enterica serovar Typhi]HAD4280018.1 hypothetical protein [Salmonella enterica subsp. enterica serovar Typhi str. CT18]ECP2736448.1 hypothetical protein [Salmonella enterica]
MSLFTIKRAKNKLHDSFKLIYHDKEYAPVRDVIQSWGKGLLERNGEQTKFVNEFQTTFNSALWELYLNEMFVRLGYSVDYTKDSPDFCVTTPSGYQFNVEAVISDRPHKPPANEIFSEAKFKRQSTLKLIGKIKDKRDLFIGANEKVHPYSTMSHVVGKPFVLALAPFDSDLSLTQNNTIINRVLFGIEEPNEQDLKNGKQRKIKSIKKNEETEIPLGIFTNDSYKEISAVIFSTTATFGKAVIQSGIGRYVRATKYRTMSLNEFIEKEGMKNEGINFHKISSLNYRTTFRRIYNEAVMGSDVLICHSNDYEETHFDGLHIYYNPYAEVPLDTGVFFPTEITHNFYDTEKEEPIQPHPDGVLVSRQVFSVSPFHLKSIMRKWCPKYLGDI